MIKINKEQADRWGFLGFGELLSSKPVAITLAILGIITVNSIEDAKDEQAFIEGKIDELSEVINQAEVVEKADNKDHSIIVGSRVRVHLEGAEHEYEIVGELEADPIKNKISHESPLGQALLGKKIGDKIQVEAPVGKLSYTVIKII